MKYDTLLHLIPIFAEGKEGSIKKYMEKGVIFCGYAKYALYWLEQGQVHNRHFL